MRKVSIVAEVGPNMDCFHYLHFTITLSQGRLASSDLPEIVEDKVMVTCPSCDKSLASPLNYSGKVLCPICEQEFQVGDEDNFEIEIKDQNFWIGLLVPVSFPILISILVSTGILSGNSSPDLMGLVYFMCSLILWPVIGFGIAVVGLL